MQKDLSLTVAECKWFFSHWSKVVGRNQLHDPAIPVCRTNKKSYPYKTPERYSFTVSGTTLHCFVNRRLVNHQLVNRQLVNLNNMMLVHQPFDLSTFDKIAYSEKNREFFTDP